jgi:hypothetical protein
LAFWKINGMICPPAPIGELARGYLAVGGASQQSRYGLLAARGATAGGVVVFCR